jgi:hypothetical protein
MSEKLSPALASDKETLAPALGGKHVMGQDVDSRALKILFNTYWTSAGWRETPETASEDFAYAIAARTMFPPRSFTHDELVEELTKVCVRLTPREVGAAFIASLGSRRLELRSPLGTYAICRHLSYHAKEAGTDERCVRCDWDGYAHGRQNDLNVLNFERYKWGGVRHIDPVYAWLDLTQFEVIARPSPTSDDYAILRAVLRATCDARLGARPNELEKALAKVVKSNQAERQVIIQMLAYAGVLKCGDHPSFLDQYVSHEQRVHPGNEWEFPAGWWRGSGAVNDEAVALYFGDVTLEY